MRFALLGDHADGLDMARALAETGRHEIAVYSGPAVGAEYLARWQLKPARTGDVEEVLADPAIDAVIVAAAPGSRPGQLRRALQSEKHVLCVHPLDADADAAFEAAMLQAETHRVLLPLLPQSLHPGFRDLAGIVQTGALAPPGGALNVETAVTPAMHLMQEHRPHAGNAPLIEMRIASTEQVLADAEAGETDPALPGWDVLRLLGGEILEVAVLAPGTELDPAAVILVSGIFEKGGLFQVTLLPQQSETSWCTTVAWQQRRAELTFPQGWPGPARLRWTHDNGGEQARDWELWNPWPVLVQEFEAALAREHKQPANALGAGLEHAVTAERTFSGPPARAQARLDWEDEIRCLELDVAARRSLSRRRVTTLEYQDASEEIGFKSTMTLVGCGLIWVTLVLLILAVWLPWLGWLIIPVLGVFLLLQLLRWIVPATQPAGTRSGQARSDQQ